MSSSGTFIARRPQLRSIYFWGIGLWTLAVAASALWNIDLVQESMIQDAERDARDNFDRDALYLLNPEAMTREAHELKSHEDGTLGHISSLKPVNPKNAPDAWEAAALQSFQRGRKEGLSRVMHEGKPYLRFMRPVIVQPACLQCHADQGYKVGEIRGGISVAMPLEASLTLARNRTTSLAAVHAILWGLGALGILFATRQFRLRLDQQLRAESDLRQSEGDLNRAQAIAHVGSWCWEMPGDRVTWSSEMYRIFGVKPENFEHTVKGINKLIHPDDLLRQAQAVEVFLQGNPFQPYEYRVIRPDGEIRVVEVLSSEVERYASGKPHRVFGTAQDITGHKQAEEKLRESEWRFRELLKNISSIAVQSYGYDGTTYYWNQASEKIYGYTAEEAIGKNLLDLIIPPEMVPGVRQAIRQMAETGQPIPASELTLMRKDGSSVMVFSSHAIVQPPGRPPELFCIDIDLTEFKRAEVFQARLAMAVEQSAETIVITDLEGTILYANPAFEKTTGYTRAEAMGQNPRVLKSGKHDAGFYRQMWNTIKGGEVWHGHLINKSKDGTLYEENATISPVRDRGGAIINYVAVKRDVTREMQLESQLRQSQKMETIGQLAGGVAHDFNNILAGMLLQVELLKMEGQLPAVVLEGLTNLRADADRATNLVRQLLLYSRRSVMQPRDLDLNEVVTNFSKMLRRVISEDITLQLQLHTNVLHLRADPGMIEQVLMNLAVNSRDAMPKGGKLIIETSKATLDAAAARRLDAEAVLGDYACLSVSDTGTGIPPEALPKIFEPFFTTKDIGKGSGLGLSSVFGIVKQHKGCIEVDNRPGRGVTFKVYLPTLAVVAAELGLVIDRPAIRGGTETILLVEDEDTMRKLTRQILEQHGYRVLESVNGVEALEIWRKHSELVKLLLTDVIMPEGISGSELASRIQAEQPGLKVVYMSGYSLDAIEGGLDLGAGRNFIQKPFAPEPLLRTLRQTLDA